MSEIFRSVEKSKYTLPWSKESPDSFPSREERSRMGSMSPIALFIKMILNLLETGLARSYLKHLTELFRFLFDFAKIGDEEARFLLSTNAISTFVDFYLKTIKQSPENVVSTIYD